MLCKPVVGMPYEKNDKVNNELDLNVEIELATQCVSF